MRYITSNKQTFETTVMSISVFSHLLRWVHELGHNGSSRTCMFLRRFSYCKVLKLAVCKYVKHWRICQQGNRQTVKQAILYFSVLKSPMQFIAMDLITEYQLKSSAGNSYALTVICMLTCYTFCIWIKSKSVTDVIRADMDHVLLNLEDQSKYLCMMELSWKMNYFPLWQSN